MKNLTQLLLLITGSGVTASNSIFQERLSGNNSGTESKVESVEEFEGTLTSGESSPEIRGGWARAPVKDTLDIGTTLGDCFVRTAAELDLQILTRDYQRQQCSLHTGTLDVQSFAGCVLATITVSASSLATPYLPLPTNTGKATTDFVSWAKNGPGYGHKQSNERMMPSKVNIMVGHTGDCRAVLSEKGGAARDLTVDHKPQLATEKERIEVAGGWVHNKRVNGVLAVSRSFGDIQYKTFDGSTRFLTAEEPGGIWSKTQQVISKPDILEFSVDSCHEFIVIASDGLWDVFSSQECINFVRWQLQKQEGDLTKTAEALVAAAFIRGTADNTSAVICALNQLESSSAPVDLSTSVCPVIPPSLRPHGKLNRSSIRIT